MALCGSTVPKERENKGYTVYVEIPKKMKERMGFLEEIDRRDRSDGTDRLRRLRQIPPDTGKFLALLAANCPDGQFVEIGTSAGYSSLWISLALKPRGIRLKTFEILAAKAALARETFKLSGVDDDVELIEGDFLHQHTRVSNISFCFIDCEKDLYVPCFDLVAGKMLSGGLIVADNAIDHYDSVKPMMERAERDNRFDCLMVPIGKGEFVCRRK